MSKCSSNVVEMDYFDTCDVNLLDEIAQEMAGSCVPTNAQTRIIVTIPAKNEQINIVACLESIANQKDMYGILSNTYYEIIVLCHNCTDKTNEECRKFSISHPSITISILESSDCLINNVGAVRRVLMNIAYIRMPVSFGFIAMTDADTVVHPYWIANLLGYLKSDYALICGRIQVSLKRSTSNIRQTVCLREKYETYKTELEDRIVPIQWDPFPRHNDNSGPNMAVRAYIYDQIGGLKPIGFCEDVAFYDTIVWNNLKIRHCPFTIVTTSARTEARTPWGFGAELSTWQESKKTILQVEGLEALLTRMRVSKLIKDYFTLPSKDIFCSISRFSGIEVSELENYSNGHTTWKALNHSVEKHLDNCTKWRCRFALVPISEACKQLKDYLVLTESSLVQT